MKSKNRILGIHKASLGTLSRRDDVEKKRKIMINLILVAIFLLFEFEYAQVLQQPNPGDYNLYREKLFTVSKEKIKTLQVPWIVASTKKDLKIYFDKSLAGGCFNSEFLQQFFVLDKVRDKLKVREKGKENSRIGWARMRNFIYLPNAIKDKESRAYQKVVFIHRVEYVEHDRIGKIKFYKSPNESESYIEKDMGTANFFYVYAWQWNRYEDSAFVLVGTFPQIFGIDLDEKAFKNTIYGWCKTERVFPWDSRMALVPNEKAISPPYIFNSGPDLKRFYNNLSDSDARPPDSSILFLDPKNSWKPGEWPFFRDRRIEDYWSLFVQLNPKGFVVDIKETSEDLKFRSKNVDIVFLIDATKSMTPYINGVSDIVNDIMDNIEKKGETVNEVRFGAAVYRDYADGSDVFEVKRLTKNTIEIKTILKNWAGEVYSNPRDNYPEALFHGIEKTLSQIGYGNYHSKFLIIIGDAGNHKFDKNNYTAENIGRQLASQMVNCIMVKVNHDRKKEEIEASELEAMHKFLTDSINIQSSYIDHYSKPEKIVDGSQIRFQHADVKKLFKIDQISNVNMLKENLKRAYSQRITNFVYDMLNSYQRCIDGASIARNVGNELVLNINPIAYSSLKVRFGSRWGEIVREMIKNRAYLLKIGYIVERDPRSPNIDQFKNVFLFRRSEIRQICTNLERVIVVLDKEDLKNLWEEFIERAYGELYDPGRSLNDYSEMRGEIIYRNLSELYDKPLEKIISLSNAERQRIRGRVYSVYKKLKDILDKGTKRFFGPRNDPYIWLYNEELP